MLPLATDLPKITQMLRSALHSTGSRFLDRQRRNEKADVSRRELRPGKVVKRAQSKGEEPGQQEKRGLAGARLQQHPRQQFNEASSAWGSSPNQRPATNTSRVCAAPNGFTLLAKIPSAVRLMALRLSRATLSFPVPACLSYDSEDSSRLLGALWRCYLRSTYCTVWTCSSQGRARCVVDSASLAAQGRRSTEIFSVLSLRLHPLCE
ncbi:hypothetical protein ASPSYDRAFT_30669 [Aspergillus sydowii CBS 593.65]|uniref:Uncharacterized protein n=1 Tax=Aspergillus sydowii CBS 593.65 TaxID=1036612 RepID=A0A1L9TK90_9EURO|nr:uncharacterized protein ASPSYDRAFT_30669 [Aspergillus sydowii CBS 593.65]OJJ59837.1 hypothetical protein ASPSYDRAFT_30669 [Aspergillus sydowii CBS 593.65]